MNTITLYGLSMMQAEMYMKKINKPFMVSSVWTEVGKCICYEYSDNYALYRIIIDKQLYLDNPIKSRI